MDHNIFYIWSQPPISPFGKNPFGKKRQIGNEKLIVEVQSFNSQWRGRPPKRKSKCFKDPCLNEWESTKSWVGRDFILLCMQEITLQSYYIHNVWKLITNSMRFYSSTPFFFLDLAIFLLLLFPLFAVSESFCLPH